MQQHESTADYNIEFQVFNDSIYANISMFIIIQPLTYRLTGRVSSGLLGFFLDKFCDYLLLSFSKATNMNMVYRSLLLPKKILCLDHGEFN